jgi:nucleotide-binding universal stress UspA family protein
MNIRHILVATDLSEISAMAYRHAAGLARQLGSSVTLLNVDEVSQFGFHSSSEINAYLERISSARALLLANAEEAFHRLEVSVKIEKVVGDPVDKILEVVQTHEVDLLVMSKRGLRSIKRMILGGTSKRVLRRVKIPTLVVPATIPKGGVPSTPSMFKRILAATDFSRASKWGLMESLALAEKLDAQVEYVHVLRLPIPIPAIPGEAPVLIPRESSEQIRHTLSQDLSAIVGEVGAKRCTPSVAIGTSVAQTLKETAIGSEIDLITIPSHGRSGVEVALFGSTAENVVKLSSVPVLVLPLQYLTGLYEK